MNKELKITTFYLDFMKVTINKVKVIKLHLIVQFYLKIYDKNIYIGTK